MAQSKCVRGHDVSRYGRTTSRRCRECDRLDARRRREIRKQGEAPTRWPPGYGFSYSAAKGWEWSREVCETKHLLGAVCKDMIRRFRGDPDFAYHVWMAEQTLAFLEATKAVTTSNEEIADWMWQQVEDDGEDDRGLDVEDIEIEEEDIDELAYAQAMPEMDGHKEEEADGSVPGGVEAAG